MLDENQIILGHYKKQYCSVAGIVYIVMKFIPVLAFLFISHLNEMIQFLIISVLAIINFWLTENIFGMLLIGLRWYFHWESDMDGFKFKFYSKPDPFVPLTLDIVVFWYIFFAVIILWSILTLIEFAKKQMDRTLLGLILFFSELFNLLMFGKAFNLAKEAHQRSVLQQIQDEVVSFPMAQSGDYEEESTADQVVDEEFIKQIQISASDEQSDAENNILQPDQQKAGV